MNRIFTFAALLSFSLSALAVTPTETPVETAVVQDDFPAMSVNLEIYRIQARGPDLVTSLQLGSNRSVTPFSVTRESTYIARSQVETDKVTNQKTVTVTPGTVREGIEGAVLRSENGMALKLNLASVDGTFSREFQLAEGRNSDVFRFGGNRYRVVSTVKAAD